MARTAPAPNFYDGGAILGEVAIRRRQDGGYTVAASSTNEHFVGADTLRYFSEFLPALRSSTRFLDVRFGGDLSVAPVPHPPLARRRSHAVREGARVEPANRRPMRCARCAPV